MRLPEVPKNLNFFSRKGLEKKPPQVDVAKQLSSQDIVELQPKPEVEGAHVEKGPPTDHEIGVLYSQHPVRW